MRLGIFLEYLLYMDYAGTIQLKRILSVLACLCLCEFKNKTRVSLGYPKPKNSLKFWENRTTAQYFEKTRETARKIGESQKR